MGRILALDVGRRRIGLALSDEFGWSAQGLPTMERVQLQKDLVAMSELMSAHHVKMLLVGEPIHLSGSTSRQATYTHGFADRLHKLTRVPLVYWDERLTSKHAERVLREGGVRTRENPAMVDQVSAVILLDSYLNSTAFQEIRAQFVTPPPTA